jgi:hypothetical protein
MDLHSLRFIMACTQSSQSAVSSPMPSRNGFQQRTSLFLRVPKLSMWSHTAILSSPAPNNYNYHNSGHYPLSCFLFKHVLEIEFCLRLQVETTQFSSIDRAGICLQTPAWTPIGFIKPTRVNIFYILNLHTHTHMMPNLYTRFVTNIVKISATRTKVVTKKTNFLCMLSALKQFSL